MKKRSSGAYTWFFYRKRSASFLGNVYKATITGDEEDIHGIRTDGKKLFALCSYFGRLDPGATGKLRCGRAFRPLYRRAGRVREAQVNRRLLNTLQLPGTYDSFSAWLEQEEQKAFRKFLRLAGRYDEAGLARTEKQIRRVCRESPGGKQRRILGECIRRCTRKIGRLLSGAPGEKEFHRARQVLKELSVLATLRHALRPSPETELIISAANSAEVMIGDWHDRVALRDSMDRYVRLHDDLPEQELAALDLLEKELAAQRNALAEHFLPEVDILLQLMQREPLRHLEH